MRTFLVTLAAAAAVVVPFAATHPIKAEPTQLVTLYSKADFRSDVIAKVPVDDVRILCGYGFQSFEVVETVDGVGGYAVVSDERCGR